MKKLMLVLVLTACGGGSVSPDAGAEFSMGQACDYWARVECDFAQRCNLMFGDYASCLDDMARICCEDDRICGEPSQVHSPELQRCIDDSGIVECRTDPGLPSCLQVCDEIGSGGILCLERDNDVDGGGLQFVDAGN